MNKEKKKLTTRELPVSERPYEIMEEKGAGGLTDAQLLAVIIRTGTTRESSVTLCTRMLAELDHFGQDPLIALSQMSLTAMKSIDGIGRVKALQISAALEIARRISSRSIARGRIKVSTRQLADLFMDRMRFSDRESAWAAYINARNELLDEQFLGYGTVANVLVDFRQIFKKGFDCGASRFVLLHSHPSGDPTPSIQDQYLTEELMRAGELLQMPMADHIVIGDRTYYSFKEQGEFDETGISH